MRIGLSIGFFSLALCAANAIAEDAPDGLALLKRHPQFATVLKITKFSGETFSSQYDEAQIMLCRSLDPDVYCERFDGNAARLDDLADYAYLFAVYQGGYGRFKPGRGDKNLAESFLEEAADGTYARALLHAHDDGSCGKAKDPTRCIMHKLYEDIGIQRYATFKEKHSLTSYSTDEQGEGDPFGFDDYQRRRK
jgi:hypothetical protein